MTVTRFAPSPTGRLHVGNLRTALFNFLIARKEGGTFILRLDDTDPERSREEYVDAIKRDLVWLGLHWDRVERQSHRLDRYEAARQRLAGEGRLYEAFETPGELEIKRKKQLAMGRPPVYDRAALALDEAEKDRLRAERGGHWRFKLAHERIVWKDGILGEVSIDAASVSDPVLIRGDGQVLYTFASSVDDVEMGITDVVRGSDHVTNTATQIQIIGALGAEPPGFSHHSLLTGPQGEPLSKRIGALALGDLREAGVEPMALLSLMARLGSADPVELRGSVGELVKGFDITRFGAAPTKFDPADLTALSARVLHRTPYEAVADEIAELGVPGPIAQRFWEVVRDNIGARREMDEWWAILGGAAPGSVAEDDRDFVEQALGMLGDPPYDPQTWSDWTGRVQEATGRKGRGLYMPLRRAVTGRAKGPDMSEVMTLMQARPRV